MLISKLLNPKSLVGKILKPGHYKTHECRKVELQGDGKITLVQYNTNIHDDLCLTLTLSSHQTFYFKTSETLPL